MIAIISPPGNTRYIVNSKISKSMEKVISKKIKKPFLVKIADRLVKDQQDLDELAVQLSLGKAEARDKFEEAKMKMRKRVWKITNAVSSEFEQGIDWVQSLKEKLSNLMGHLDKGRAETKETFKQQKQSILKGLDEVEKEMQKSPEASKLSRTFALASEKIKLQMEMLEKKLSAGKQELTKEFHEEMDKAMVKMHSIAVRLREKKEDAAEKLEEFKDELHESYDHLKKAVRSM
jgi:hypothetical protein